MSILNLDMPEPVQADTLIRDELHQGQANLLQDGEWPPVDPFGGMSSELSQFLERDAERQGLLMKSLARRPDVRDRFIHESLSCLYAHRFGYPDGPAAVYTDDDLERATFNATLVLERELLERSLAPDPSPALSTPDAVADYLEELAESNRGVCHPLFDYLRDVAPRWQLEVFLCWEVIRNEVVDDEVALLVVGLQGASKAVAAANLWDECGRGKLEHFHTYWLRRLIAALPGGEAFFRQVRQHHPWFASVTSNLNACLLTRPAFTLHAYGCFLIFESWVEPHFRRLLDGMDRVRFSERDLRLYFQAHVAIDPRHSRELAAGIRQQRPAYRSSELSSIIAGAHLAVEAGSQQFDHILHAFQQADDVEALYALVSSADVDLAEGR